jgi:hypothetical protein
MLRPITTSSASAGAAPTAVHGSAAATLSPHQSRATAVGTVESAQPQAGAGNAEQMFRYNSFRFIYRQDVGRIVLIGQSPETGERVIQVPSEEALRAYERTERVERLARIQGGHSAEQQSTFTPSTPKPQLTKALMAAVSGDNHGSAVVSVSA